ncbi:sema domain, immunoglobulin domain (Ig), short basic domain, secreted, (semaphorin) 3H [Anguilla anguilla]|uniref:sema domain, immunoglobulin domain (Ig), short basic domain, secreted, (semaphorin) 3H n=1 Tax=Anguilla anguilla TaxID=7936 RepID=UPI0015B01216|nr:sema domain, immunoglobulin domain (Ig), short basic domain, secreted, (semaphorin) 3H [Anguilla anguilla]
MCSAMLTLGPLLLLVHLGSILIGAWRPSQPRLQFTHKELVQNGRLLALPIPAGDLYALLPDEDTRRLYGAMKDQLLVTSLDDITHSPRQLYWPASPDRIQECLMAGKDPEYECANFLRVLELYNHTHLYICGTGAFNPRCAFIPTTVFLEGERQVLLPEQTDCGKGKCPYDPHQRTATAVIDGELYSGISSDFMSRDSAFFRSLGTRHVIRSEQYDSTWLQDAQFIKVASVAESDNPEDDKVYIFFTEHAQEAEGAAGKVIYSRVARVCKNDIGGQRSLVNKWSTFLKARMVCSIPGADGVHTHFDQLQDIFILHGKDKTNPLIYGLFTTSSDVLNGSAVCVYRMQDVARVFKGHFAHKEGPEYKWAEFTGRVPFPRPGTCPSRTYGNYRSTREYPDDVIFFSRTHPLMMEAVYPVEERPLLVRVGVQYKFSRLLVDRVEAVDGQYDVMFIGTDSGLVLKSIHLPKKSGDGSEVTLEQLQVFEGRSAITAMTLSKKRWLFVGSKEGVAQLALFQCELYGQACAECCLARDPYCTWDGHACSPFIPIARRRNARQVGDAGDPLTQCVKQGAGLQVEAEEKVMVVAEGNSTYLECLPKSQHAAITWFREERGGSHKLHQVKSEEQLVVIDRGVLIRRAEPGHSGTYHCQLEEHGFSWTAVTVQLRVLSSSSGSSWSMADQQHCEQQGRRRYRNKNRKRMDGAENNSQGHRRPGGGIRGGGGEEGGAAKVERGGGGRKSRSKPQPLAQRSPRSI